MKFALTTAASTYEDKAVAKELMQYGIEMEEPDVWPRDRWSKPFFRESDREENIGEVEINSLEELLAFAEKWERLVVTKDSIQIYDSYRE